MNPEDVFKSKSDKDNVGKYFGKFRAVVKKIDDPEKLGRIRVTCPDIYGKDMSPWAWPCLPYGGSDETGFFMIPEIESGVWLEFEQGCPTNPIWSGVWWTKPNDNNEVPDVATAKYGKVKMIKTKSGHTIEFDDEANTIKVSNGQSGSYIIIGSNVTVHSEGNIILECPNGIVDVR